MDTRKIEFLIAMQREIDKAEAREGASSTRVERLKSRFYDVVEVEEVVKGNGGQEAEKASQRQVATADTDSPEHGDWQDWAVSSGSDITDYIVDDDAINAVKKFLKNAPLQTNTPNNIKKDLILEFLHRPKDVAEFMKLFDDANDLKYLTHDYDETDKTFDIHGFLSHAKTKFDLYAKKYTIPPSLWRIINEFAFKEEPSWFAGKVIKEGWSSPKWVTWAESKGHPAKDRSFEEIIQAFKQYTRVKGSLQRIVQSAIDKKFKDRKPLFNFTYVDLDILDFYTHVGVLTTALENLFDEICERDDCPNIRIEGTRNAKGSGGYRERIITIFQENSYPINKTLDEFLEKYKQRGGYLSEVRPKLFGYCDWHIETVWDGKPVRLTLLKEGMKTTSIDVEVEELNTVVRPGFSHILTFYFR